MWSLVYNSIVSATLLNKTVQARESILLGGVCIFPCLLPCCSQVLHLGWVAVLKSLVFIALLALALQRRLATWGTAGTFEASLASLELIKAGKSSLEGRRVRQELACLALFGRRTMTYYDCLVVWNINFIFHPVGNNDPNWLIHPDNIVKIVGIFIGWIVRCDACNYWFYRCDFGIDPARRLTSARWNMFKHKQRLFSVDPHWCLGDFLLCLCVCVCVEVPNAGKCHEHTTGSKNGFDSLTIYLPAIPKIFPESSSPRIAAGHQKKNQKITGWWFGTFFPFSWE